MISMRCGYRWGLSFSLILLLLQPVLVAAAPLAERQVLENGLTLLVRSSRALPTVTIRVTVQAGSLWEREGRAGLADLAALLLTRGTASRTAALRDERKGTRRDSSHHSIAYAVS